MTSFDLIWGAAIAALLGFQGWLTARILKSDVYDPDQKRNQVKLIWFVPIAGALLVAVMMWHMRDEHVGKPR